MRDKQEFGRVKVLHVHSACQLPWNRLVLVDRTPLKCVRCRLNFELAVPLYVLHGLPMMLAVSLCEVRRPRMGLAGD